MTVATLPFGFGLTGYYAFFAVIEVATTSYIALVCLQMVRNGRPARACGTGNPPAASLDSEPLRTPQQT